MYKSTLPLLFATITSLMACGEEEKSVDTGTIDIDTDTSDTGNTGNDTDTDTSDTDTDTSDTDTDTSDTGDTGNDTADTGENTNDTGVVDTADTGTIDTGNPVGPGPNAVVDFSLPDANPASPTVGQAISPRDYLEQVSGWYFIKAT